MSKSFSNVNENNNSTPEKGTEIPDDLRSKIMATDVPKTPSYTPDALENQGLVREALARYQPDVPDDEKEISHGDKDEENIPDEVKNNIDSTNIDKGSASTLVASDGNNNPSSSEQAKEDKRFKKTLDKAISNTSLSLNTSDSKASLAQSQQTPSAVNYGTYSGTMTIPASYLRDDQKYQLGLAAQNLDNPENLEALAKTNPHIHVADTLQDGMDVIHKVKFSGNIGDPWTPGQGQSEQQRFESSAVLALGTDESGQRKSMTIISRKYLEDHKDELVNYAVAYEQGVTPKSDSLKPGDHVAPPTQGIESAQSVVKR